MVHPRFAAFEIDGQRRYGSVGGGGIVDLHRRHGSRWSGLKEVIEADALAQLTDIAAGLSPDYADGEFRLLPPIEAPEKISCVGVNYPDRNEEYRDGQAAPNNPSLFIRFPRL